MPVESVVMSDKSEIPPSGVGVIDKAMTIMAALESGPADLTTLVAATGIPRPTLHRIAAALIHHRLLTKDERSRYVLGHRIGELAAAMGGDDPLAVVAPDTLRWLAEMTGESTQVYRRQGDLRLCVATAERPVGFRDTIPIGSRFSMKAGSAAQVFLAWEDHDEMVSGLDGAVFSASTLAQVRRQGWAQTVAEREDGLGSVSAPIRAANGKVVAAVSMSGPVDRITRHPGKLHATSVVAAAHRISDLYQNYSA